MAKVVRERRSKKSSRKVLDSMVKSWKMRSAPKMMRMSQRPLHQQIKNRGDPRMMHQKMVISLFMRVSVYLWIGWRRGYGCLFTDAVLVMTTGLNRMCVVLLLGPQADQHEEGEGPINDDLEENYEKNNGMDVRKEEVEEEEGAEEEAGVDEGVMDEGMPQEAGGGGEDDDEDLPENMELDGGDGGVDETPQDEWKGDEGEEGETAESLEMMEEGEDANDEGMDETPDETAAEQIPSNIDGSNTINEDEKEDNPGDREASYLHSTTRSL